MALKDVFAILANYVTSPRSGPYLHLSQRRECVGKPSGDEDPVSMVLKAAVVEFTYRRAG